MVFQKQKNDTRYTNSLNIFLIGILTVILVIRFGILLQRSHNDILTLSNQIKSESERIYQRSHVKVQRSTINKKNNITSNTWIVTSTWNK